MRGCFVPTISAKVFWESPSEVRTSRSRLPKSADRRWTRGSLRAIFSFCSSRSYRKRNGAQNQPSSSDYNAASF